MKYVKIVLAVLVLMIMTGWAMMLYSYTVIAWWIVPALALATGLVTGVRKWTWWRRLTCEDSKWLNYVCHTAYVAAFASFAFFAANYYLADRSSEHVESGVVKEHYRQERRKTRRVGRRYTATGEKYYVYKLEIELQGGKTKLMDVNYNRYRRVRNGDSLTVPVTPGALGFPILTTDSIHFRHTTPSRRRR